MKEILMTITSKGQVTIPAEVRRYLGLRKRQKIALVIGKNGEVKWKVPRYPNIDSIVGRAGASRRRLSWQQTLDIARADNLKAKLAK